MQIQLQREAKERAREEQLAAEVKGRTPEDSTPSIVIRRSARNRTAKKAFTSRRSKSGDDDGHNSDSSLSNSGKKLQRKSSRTAVRTSARQSARQVAAAVAAETAAAEKAAQEQDRKGSSRNGGNGGNFKRIGSSSDTDSIEDKGAVQGNENQSRKYTPSSRPSMGTMSKRSVTNRHTLHHEAMLRHHDQMRRKIKAVVQHLGMLIWLF